ncbi:MAG: FMN-binding negative transcriptional regulator [Sphingobacteriales bacterium]|nr:FMN-binding negative transcriptional regulator [Sphingobacteriales bacterium]
MYIPKYFKQNDRKKSIAFMNAYNFAIVVSAKDELPLATHLPFVIEERENEIVLISHMSKANEQWKTFSDKDVLVIFSEPHAYISPSLYEQKQNVPTWNYVAVHAYGKINILKSDEEKLAVLHKQMQSYEADFIEQFRTLDKKYIDGLLQGIIAFEITVSNLQAKEKLNQNKSEKDRLNVKKHLEESEDEMKRTLGKMM